MCQTARSARNIGAHAGIRWLMGLAGDGERVVGSYCGTAVSVRERMWITTIMGFPFGLFG